MEHMKNAYGMSFPFGTIWVKRKLASFKADQRPYHSSAANHVGAAVLAQVARSGRFDAAHRWTKPKRKYETGGT